MPFCDCKLRHCHDAVHPVTGKRGLLLDARTYRKHQADESENNRRVTLEDHASRHESALRVQQNEIEQALSRLSIDSPPAPTSHVGRMKYKVDYKKYLLSQVGQWEEHLTGLANDAKALGLAPTQASSANIHLALVECHRIHTACGEIRELFKIACEGRLRKEPSVKVVLSQLQDHFDQVLHTIRLVETSWEELSKLHKIKERELILQGGSSFDSAKHFQSFLGDAPVLVQLASLMVVVCHVILGLPRRGCVWLFAMCAYIVETAIHQAGVSGGPARIVINIINRFPRDVRAATDNFHLDGKSTIYAACPKCHETYKPTDENGIPSYPQRCNSHKYTNRCGELLLRPKRVRNHQVFLPIKPYVVYDFPDWLASLMSRTGYEQQMDGAWSRTPPAEGNMEDIFHGSIVRNFKGADGKTHFSQAGPDKETGRYLFSMGFDFFNPHRNLANGKRVSVGVIAFVCLNLPIAIRYKPENIFLGGIIPGPKEPSVDFINPYLRPFIDVFLQLWKGMRFSRTSLYELGRWVLCALIAIICDIPAARKIGGFSACSHEYFCSRCWCNKTEHGYSHYDYRSWVWRTSESCRTWAERFRDAPTQKLASSSFDKSGLRYSVLLELPYYEPENHLVVDPMHNLFLGLIKEHFQGILGYVPRGAKLKGTALEPKIELDFTVSPTVWNPIPMEPNERASVKKLMTHLKAPLEFDPMDPTAVQKTINSWANAHLCALVYVAKGLGCIPATVDRDGRDSNVRLPFVGGKLAKKDVVERLVLWRIRQHRTHAENEPSYPGMLPGCVFTHDEISSLWNDIEDMIKPSWATSVPNNISSAGAKLKSDQWRSVGVLFLPVTLIRIWSTYSNGGNDTHNERRDLLHLTMLLCSAIGVITSRSVSNAHADLYLSYMLQYRQELKRIFPQYQVHPNHHMALHIDEFIRMYGPIHGWWTFPFERMIGSLQRVSVNYKPGEYERTIARSWTISSNFRAIFSKDTCPKAIRFCAEMFERLTKTGNNNTLADSFMASNNQSEEDMDETNGDNSRLSAAVYQAVQSAAQPLANVPQSAIVRNRITVQGISLTTNAIHDGNSGVLFYGSNVPFCIVDILEFPGDSPIERIWLVVKRHKRAQIMTDPYARYPHIRAKLWDMELEDILEAVPLSQVETHFAKCAVSWEGRRLVVVVSLSKIHLV